MTSKQLDTLTDRQNTLQGPTFFRPQSGPLKERLIREIMQCATDEVAEALSEATFDLEVSVFQPEGESPVLTFSVDHPGVLFTSRIAVSALSEEAQDDLDDHLSRLGDNDPSALFANLGKTQSRKRQYADYLEKDPASTRLKVSADWLKRVIPCTDYSYEEIDGKKYIREYYWSKQLIERLVKIKSTKTTPEDLQYVAKECCDGDPEWARDLIARLKSPNRPEAAPKEQSQKNQAKPAQPQAAPGDRTRNRSRHKRPVREPAREGGGKPQPQPSPAPKENR